MNIRLSENSALVPDVIVPILTFMVTAWFACATYFLNRKLKKLQTFSIKISAEMINGKDILPSGKIEPRVLIIIKFANISNVTWYINDECLLYDWKKLGNSDRSFRLLWNSSVEFYGLECKEKRIDINNIKKHWPFNPKKPLIVEATDSIWNKYKYVFNHKDRPELYN